MTPAERTSAFAAQSELEARRDAGGRSWRKVNANKGRPPHQGPREKARRVRQAVRP